MKLENIKVLFIAGSGRSGSTILSTLLGQLDGVVSIGESAALWKGLLENRPCGCTMSLGECVFWEEVLESRGVKSRGEIQELLEIRNRLMSQPVLRRLPFVPGSRTDFRKAARQYAKVLEALYRSISQLTGCSVIVDSSKLPAHGYAIGLIPAVELHVLHLVRDSRAVAFSKQRKKQRTPKGWEPQLMSRLSLSDSARKWIGENAQCEYFWARDSERYKRLRYEDFARQPKGAIKNIVETVREDIGVHFFLSPSVARIEKATHQIEGNPAKFHAGVVKIETDEEWSSAMPRRDKVLMTTMTWPLLLRYGYWSS